jgi:hypothetical protein
VYSLAEITSSFGPVMPRPSPGKRGIHLVEEKSGNPEQQKDPLTRKTFKTGEVVPQSGIYRVTHGDHRLPHEVTLLRSQEFPPCSKCGVQVKFKLLRGVTVESFKIVLNALPEIPEGIAALDDLKKTAG